MSRKHAELVTKLLSRTNAGEISWTQATNDDEFVVNLSKTSISIKQVRSRTGNAAPGYVVTLFDSTGSSTGAATKISTEFASTPVA